MYTILVFALLFAVVYGQTNTAVTSSCVTSYFSRMRCLVGAAAAPTLCRLGVNSACHYPACDPFCSLCGENEEPCAGTCCPSCYGAKVCSTTQVTPGENISPCPQVTCDPASCNPAADQAGSVCGSSSVCCYDCPASGANLPTSGVCYPLGYCNSLSSATASKCHA